MGAVFANLHLIEYHRIGAQGNKGTEGVDKSGDVGLALDVMRVPSFDFSRCSPRSSLCYDDIMTAAMTVIDRETGHALRVFTDALEDRFDVFEARLFGSRARGTHSSESDIDLAVLLSGSRGDFVATKLAMADIAFDAMLETGLLVEPLPIWLDEWTQPGTHSNPRLLENIAREGIHL